MRRRTEGELIASLTLPQAQWTVWQRDGMLIAALVVAGLADIVVASSHKAEFRVNLLIFYGYEKKGSVFGRVRVRMYLTRSSKSCHRERKS